MARRLAARRSAFAFTVSPLARCPPACLGARAIGVAEFHAAFFGGCKSGFPAPESRATIESWFRLGFSFGHTNGCKVLAERRHVDPDLVNINCS